MTTETSPSFLTPEQRAAVRAALTSSGLTLITGRGSAKIPGSGEACTISEILLTLTGKLDDGPHPCICEVIRCWVIRIQDAMPDKIRNSMAWREAAAGIAGSAAGPEVTRRRVDFLLNWMWGALSDEAVLASIPGSAQPAWERMLTERTSATAHVAADAATRAADAATRAADAITYAALAADSVSNAAYWRRRDLPGTLAALIAITEES